MTTPQSASDYQEQQRRRVRRTTLILSLIAAAFYLGFIVMSVSKGLK